MVRYIDKDKVIEEIARLANRSMVGEIDEPYLDWKTVVSVIFDAQAADVQEVRHGHWIEDKETGCLICSECGRFTDEIIGDMTEADEDIALALGIPPKTIIHRSMNPFYCSKCGAKMDGKE